MTNFGIDANMISNPYHFVFVMQTKQSYPREYSQFTTRAVGAPSKFTTTDFGSAPCYQRLFACTSSRHFSKELRSASL